MPQLGRLKEAVRPYYLRWLYFPLRPRQRPAAFQACWQYPFRKVVGSVRLADSSAVLPDLLFYPMTDWHTRIQRTQHLVRAFAALGFRCIYSTLTLAGSLRLPAVFDRAHRLAELEHNIYRVACPASPRAGLSRPALVAGEEEDSDRSRRAAGPALPGGQSSRS